MRRTLFLSWLSLVSVTFFAQPPVSAVSPIPASSGLLAQQVPSRLIELACQGSDQNYCMDLEGARETYQTMIKEFPNHPAGYLCLAGLIEFEMIVKDDHSQEDQFLELLEKCFRLSDAEARKGNKLAACFFSGAAYGYRGFSKVEKKEWVGAVRDARNMASELKRVVKLDPRCYEAYYGLGLHDYYRSKASKKLDFLPFFEDRTQEGMEEIKISADRAIIMGVAAKAALMEIYYDEKQYDKAMDLVNWMIERYPSYWFTYWVKGGVFKNQNKFEDAAAAYGQAVAILDARFPDENLERMHFRMRQADMYLQIGKKQEARTIFQQVCEWPPSVQDKESKRMASVKQAATEKLKSIQGS